MVAVQQNADMKKINNLRLRLIACNEQTKRRTRGKGIEIYESSSGNPAYRLAVNNKTHQADAEQHHG